MFVRVRAVTGAGAFLGRAMTGNHRRRSRDMPTKPDGERSSAEVLSEADRVLATLEEQVEEAKREKRRARRLRRAVPPRSAEH